MVMPRRPSVHQPAIAFSLARAPARLQRTRGLGENHADHNQIGIAQVLKSIDKNYRAAHIGKWHIDADPARYGFDVHDGMTKNKAGDFDNKPKQWHGYAQDDPKRVHSITGRGIAFMRDAVDKQQPFFSANIALCSALKYCLQRVVVCRGRQAGKGQSAQKSGLCRDDSGYGSFCWYAARSL